MHGILNYILWTPIVGLLAILFLPSEKKNWIRWTALGTTALTLVFTFVCYSMFKTGDGTGGIQFAIKFPWIEKFNIFYSLGIDGLSMPMVILNASLFFLCILSSWTIEKHVKSYFVLMLMLESSVFGVFLALDFFLFYVYWEVMLLPMFFLIGIWGGENREYAAVKFFLYTFFGSIFMLVAIVGLYYMQGKGVDGFNVMAMHADAGMAKFAKEQIHIFGYSLPFNKVMFWFLFLGFAIKVPMFPFHTWLPHAHVQAPTAISVILAGVLLKMGTYGFLRFAFPIFPEAAVDARTIIAALGLISVIYGGFCAMAQDDVKRLVAYSSVSHMGFVMLGLAAMTLSGTNGAVLQMFNHGTSTAMMFLLIGILYERSHHRWIVRPDGTRGFSGLYTQMPNYTIIFIIGMFASLGLPGMSGFISEALIFLGIYKEFTTFTVIAVVGLLIGAAYLLWMFKRMFFGEPNDAVKDYPDVNAREIFYMVPLCVTVIAFGIYPMPILNMMSATVGDLVKLMASFQ